MWNDVWHFFIDIRSTPKRASSFQTPFYWSRSVRPGMCNCVPFRLPPINSYVFCPYLCIISGFLSLDYRLVIKKEFLVMFARSPTQVARRTQLDKHNSPSKKKSCSWGREKITSRSRVVRPLYFSSSSVCTCFVYVFRWVLEYVGLSRKRMRIFLFFWNAWQSRAELVSANDNVPPPHTLPRLDFLLCSNERQILTFF
jgi:hypothetical protein